ncbi:hypothetical protein IKE87_01200 [Candidatus Saccharibacteria bacterium]|nr:hypothetical protein [Candidatus Saccharibacteria bacterium]
MNWRKWLDEFILAGRGILLATKEKRFWYGFVPSYFLFGFLMVFFSDTANFSMASAIGFPFIREKFLGIFGFHLAFTDWLPIFCISLLQSILIGLIVLLWHKKRSKSQTTNAENIGSASLITGLIALGAGCPTCGVTLLTPIIGMFASAGTALIVGAVSRIITIIAIIIAILSLKRLGEEVYVIIVNEKYLAKKKAKTSAPAESTPSSSAISKSKTKDKENHGKASQNQKHSNR